MTEFNAYDVVKMIDDIYLLCGFFDNTNKNVLGLVNSNDDIYRRRYL